MLKDATYVSALYPCNISEMGSNLVSPNLFVDDNKVSLPDREVEASEEDVPHNHSLRGRGQELSSLST